MTVTRLDEDFRAIDVELKLHFWNRNWHGTQFGGSLFSMTDPFPALMLIQNLGPEYAVWDKSAAIRYRRPGQGRVRAEFRFEAGQLEATRAELADGGKSEPKFHIEIRDEKKQLIAEVDKVLHVSRRKP